MHKKKEKLRVEGAAGGCGEGKRKGKRKKERQQISISKRFTK